MVDLITEGTQAPPKTRSMGWVFTLNNYTPEDVERLKALATDCSVRYCCFGKELSPTTNTPHLQGYIFYHSQRFFNGVKSHLGSRCYVATAKADSLSNKHYCEKDGDFTEFGDRPKTQSEKGASSKAVWDEIYKAAAEKRYDDIPGEHKIRYNRAIFSIYADEQRTKRPHNIDDYQFYWIYGPSRTGKSHLGRALLTDLGCEQDGWFEKLPDAWWGGYNGEPYVLMDEMSPDEACPASSFKRWCDKYPFPAKVKGKDDIMIRPKFIVMISNYMPQEIWTKSQDYIPIYEKVTVIHLYKLGLFHILKLRPNGDVFNADIGDKADVRQHISRLVVQVEKL